MLCRCWRRPFACVRVPLTADAPRPAAYLHVPRYLASRTPRRGATEMIDSTVGVPPDCYPYVLYSRIPLSTMHAIAHDAATYRHQMGHQCCWTLPHTGSICPFIFPSSVPSFFHHLFASQVVLGGTMLNTLRLNSQLQLYLLEGCKLI